MCRDYLLAAAEFPMAKFTAGTEIRNADANYPEVYEETVLPVILQRPEWWPKRCRQPVPRQCHL